MTDEDSGAFRRWKTSLRSPSFMAVKLTANTKMFVTIPVLRSYLPCTYKLKRVNKVIWRRPHRISCSTSYKMVSNVSCTFLPVDVCLSSSLFNRTFLGSSCFFARKVTSIRLAVFARRSHFTDCHSTHRDYWSQKRQKIVNSVRQKWVQRG